MDILVFLIIFEIIGLLAFPVATALAGNLRDRGYSLARPLGIIVITLIAGLLSSLRLTTFTTGIYAGLLVLAVLAAFIIYLHCGDLGHSFLKKITEHPFIRDLCHHGLKRDREMLVQEGIFILTFLLAALFLMHKPEIFSGHSEDFMNAAFLQSALHTDFLPLSDPWFAGTGLTYYYLGQLAAAVPVVLSGVKATIGYNLAVAAFFAMGVQAAYGLGLNLTKKRVYGFAAAVLTMVAGFPAGFVQLLSYICGRDILLFETFSGSFTEWLVSFDFTAATRIIPDTINLYPFFTFLQGDLHAHFISITFLLCLIGICLALSEQFSWKTFLAAIAVAVFLVGVNAWNLPAALFLLAWTAWVATKKKAFLSVIGLAGCIFVASLFIRLVGILDPGQRTDLSGFLLIFGVFAFISLAYLIDSHIFARQDIPIAALAILVLTISYLFNFELAVLPLLAIPFFWRAWHDEEFPAILAGIALLMITFCEFFFINDAYGPPSERMNTVMKFYLQAWVFWGIASAYLLSRIKNRALVAVAVIMIAIALIHPLGCLVSMPDAEFMGQTDRLTLDGAAWLSEQKPDEYNALCWLRNTAESGDVVLEAPGDAYTYSSRVPAFTGLSTVMGWHTHEVMWGRGWEATNQRCADIDSIYTEGSQELLAKYDVRYIFAGETEQTRYGSLDNISGYEEGTELAFQSGEVSIYRVV